MVIHDGGVLPGLARGAGEDDLTALDDVEPVGVVRTVRAHVIALRGRHPQPRHLHVAREAMHDPAP